MADDDADILEALRGLLATRPGVRVELARDGREALARLRAGRFDAVLADERMPGAPGSEVLAWAMAHRPGTRRILMTAHRGLHAPAAERVLWKPFGSAALWDALGARPAARASPASEAFPFAEEHRLLAAGLSTHAPDSGRA